MMTSLLLLAAGGCKADRCRGEAPAFQVSMTLEAGLAAASVTALLIQVEAAGIMRKETMIMPPQLTAEQMAFWVRVGDKGAQGFRARVEVTALDGGGVSLAHGKLDQQASGDACNFFQLELKGTAAGDGGPDAARDLSGPDGASLDAAGPDATKAADLWLDMAKDSAGPDMALDAGAPDLAAGDMAVVDMAGKDKAAGDMAAADQNAANPPDMTKPADKAPPDKATFGTDWLTGDSQLDQYMAPDAPWPDMGAPDLKTCGGAAACDDKLPCTVDTCGDGGLCQHSVLPSFCVAGGACVVAGSLNPGKPCQICAPTTSPWGWSNRTGLNCDDGKPCTHGDTCAGGQCKGTPYLCDDKAACTLDLCTGAGPTGGCAHLLKPGGCFIDGKCLSPGQTSPSSHCLKCDVARDLYKWTPVHGKGCVTTFAGKPGKSGSTDGPIATAILNSYRLAIAPGGTMYLSQYGGLVRTIAGGKVATLPAQFSSQLDGVIPVTGGIYACDGNRIMMAISGTLYTIAGKTSGGKADGPALSATFNHVRDIISDGSGGYYIADANNNAIRTLKGGKVGTLKGVSPHQPRALALHSSGTLYIAEPWAHRIGRVKGGVYSVLAGTGKSGFKDGAGGGAQFDHPAGVVVTASGDVYVADSNNRRIRKITGGTVSTVAGTGILTTPPGMDKVDCDDGPAAKASFRLPTDLDIDAKGDLYINDDHCDAIKRMGL